MESVASGEVDPTKLESNSSVRVYLMSDDCGCWCGEWLLCEFLGGCSVVPHLASVIAVSPQDFRFPSIPE